MSLLALFSAKFREANKSKFDILDVQVHMPQELLKDAKSPEYVADLVVEQCTPIIRREIVRHASKLRD